MQDFDKRSDSRLGWIGARRRHEMQKDWRSEKTLLHESRRRDLESTGGETTGAKSEK